ncbi:extracellular solute-binding protein [Harryflintia acetispora]|uniref:Carbohydrate ABC transporter substrate-binding protein (CUT1 family) n=1 Tax=Harryflintia acetispora TaxID=1849041 RepID=A0A9X8UKX7_9FIRM|nr:extracellular solute-binding protein [Harryflintia acetispora]TCL44067.1 carbohydrate ABC transporter substrate-binding protein (CUT1 family) [Harryflintia acetispora]
MNKKLHRMCMRLGASVLLGAMVFTSGCQQAGGRDVRLDPKNPVSIEIWHYYNGPQKNAFDEMISEFNDTVGLKEGIIVEAFSQGNVSELTEKVIDAANKKVGAGDIPDVFAAYADTALQVDKLGLVASLDDYLTDGELAEYIPEYIEEGRFDAQGSLKIFPIAKSTEVMMVNKTDWDKFSAATGADIEKIKTMEGLAGTAKQYYEWTDSLTPEPDDGKAFFGRDALANYFIIGCRQLGVEIFSVENGKVTFNLDKEVIRKLWDHYYVPFVHGYFAANGRFRSDDAKTGDIIALVGSTSGSAYFPDKVMVNDNEGYDIEPLVFEPPVFEGGELYAVQQGAGMVVTKTDERREYAATVFLKWFTDSERNIEFSVGSGYMPVKVAANDRDMVQKVLQGSGEAVAEGLQKSLDVALDMTKTHTLYTSKAFGGGTEARAVLEYSMADLAKADSEQVAQMVASGQSRQEAADGFCTDEHFEEWYQSFSGALEEAIQ